MVGDGLTVADLGALDAQFDRLTVDTFVGGALLVHPLVGIAVAVDLIADTGADAGGDGGGAATLGPPFVIDGTGLICLLRK